MIRVAFSFLLVITSLVAPLAAQAPEGWRARVDLSQSAADPDDISEVKVVTMGKGFRVTGGPAATVWHPSNSVAGNYSARATFNLMKPSNHTNYYGLVFGGADLETPSQRYGYFLIAQNGTYIIRSRRGDNVQDVQARSPHDAIRRPGADGRSTNTLEVRVNGNTASYVINGTVVHTTPKTAVSAGTDGIVGVRVNHLLDVHVEGFETQRQ
jgi:VCBS repeat-containing protein